MLRLALAFVLLILAAPMAQAASFDCSKAGTAFERAICTHPQLSHDDDVLAQAYATALGGLSPAAADVMKAQQHDWLAYAERVCTDDAVPLQGDYADDKIDCLHSTYRTRFTELEASRMMGGWRFYPIERFGVIKDPEMADSDYGKVADKAFSTVKIDSTEPVALAFNAMIDKDMAGYAELFGKDGKTSLSAGDPSTDIDVTTAVDAVKTHRIGLVVDNYWYGHGAAHGNYGITHLHFLVDQQRPLVASDIFAGKDWQAHLGKLVLDELQKTIEGGVWEESVKDIPGWAADPSRWNFSDAGLVVQFQPYEVTAYAAGAPTVTIPWEALDDDLTDNAQEIATY